MATTSASGPHTKAWTAFNQNLASINHLSAFTRRDAVSIRTATTRYATSVTRMATEMARLKTLAGSSPSLPARQLGAAVTKLLRSAEGWTRNIRPRLERMGTARLWQIVMLVTCVEAYLQDLLALAASVDRTLMANSQRIVPNKDIISATSLEDLVSGMSTRWAREWLRDGKPEGWISRLRNMGVEDYPDGLALRLELIWDVRHLVVHSAGIATADFIKGHPDFTATAGDRVEVGMMAVVAYVQSVKDFMEPTERYFGKRYPSLLTETVPERVK